MGRDSLFRKSPPLELVEQVFRSLRFQSITDARWFTKEELPLTNLEEWLPLLEPYYLPCKAKRFLEGEMTHQRIIVILRHLLDVHHAKIKTCERVIGGRKKTLYSIEAPSSLTPSTFSITFD
jgi:hypothetical protein